MEIQVTKEEFEAVILAATNSESDVYESVLPYINESAKDVRMVLLDKGTEALATNVELLRLVKQAMCQNGFLKAIPHLDLVLTGSGFGVVHNDHVTPASGERVKALKEAVEKARDYTFCDLISLLCTVPGWGENRLKTAFIPHILWNKRDAEELLGKADMKHSDWIKTKSELFDIQFKMAECIGHKIFAVICDDVANNRCDERIELARQFLGQTMANIYRNKKDARMTLSYMNHMVNWFEEAAEQYPEYTESKEYQARHFEGHQNKKDCPAFFFGV